MKLRPPTWIRRAAIHTRRRWWPQALALLALWAAGEALSHALGCPFPGSILGMLLLLFLLESGALSAVWFRRGLPELTAAFTTITGIFGAAIGESLLLWLPLRSSFARGALFGMGAHGAGVAKARELGEEEGAVAGLVMIFAGLLNVLVATLFLHRF